MNVIYLSVLLRTYSCVLIEDAYFVCMQDLMLEYKGISRNHYELIFASSKSH